MATQKQDYDGTEISNADSEMDESQEQDFDKSKSGEVGSEWDESVKDDETEEPVINVELDDQGNLKEEE